VIKVSILYPAKSNARFDMEYYCNSHMPLVASKLGHALEGMAIDRGLAGGTPGAPAAFVAMGHLYFETVEEFQAAFGPHAEAILSDIPNYTDIEPIVQISEVIQD
jgi:uncharacterized protein (TIGR02118 family)